MKNFTLTEPIKARKWFLYRFLRAVRRLFTRYIAVRKVLSRLYWNRNNLKKIVADHVHGRGTHIREIRTVLQINSMHQVLLEITDK